MKEKNLAKFEIQDREVVDEVSKIKIRHSLFGINKEDFWALIVKIERHYKQRYLEDVARLEGRTSKYED